MPQYPIGPSSNFLQAMISPEVTKLTPDEEVQFQQWAAKNNIQDIDHPDSHYDYRGFWKSTQGQSHESGTHFPDTFKQRAHPTFSQESKYSIGPSQGGMWLGEIYFRATAHEEIMPFDNTRWFVVNSWKYVDPKTLLELFKFIVKFPLAYFRFIRMSRKDNAV